MYAGHFDAFLEFNAQITVISVKGCVACCKKCVSTDTIWKTCSV